MAAVVTTLSHTHMYRVAFPFLPNTRIMSLQVTVGKLYMVDLAGSERLKKSKSVGLRATEARSINLSLTMLGMCISARAQVGARRVLPGRWVLGPWVLVLGWWVLGWWVAAAAVQLHDARRCITVVSNEFRVVRATRRTRRTCPFAIPS